MRILAFIVMIFGMVIAGGAVYYTQKFMHEQAASLHAEPTTVRILVAAHNLAPGKQLGSKDLKWVSFTRQSVPKGAFASVETLFGSDYKDKRWVVASIEQGEPLLSSKISGPNQPGRLITNIPAGMRVVSIAVNTVSGVSGFVNPGDHVDILLIRPGASGLVSSVVLQDVLILATDQSRNADPTKPRVARTVTILVSPRDAQLLTVAQQLGSLSLMLRGIQEAATTTPLEPFSQKDLNGTSQKTAPEKPSIIVRRGANVTSEPIPSQ